MARFFYIALLWSVSTFGLELNHRKLDGENLRDFDPGIIGELVSDKNRFKNITPPSTDFSYTEKDILPCRDEIKKLRSEGKFRGPQVAIYAEAHGEEFSEKTKKHLMQKADGQSSVLLLEGQTTNPASFSSIKRILREHDVDLKAGAFFGIDEPAPKALADLRLLFERVDELEHSSKTKGDKWKKTLTELSSVFIEQALKNDLLYRELIGLPLNRSFKSEELGFISQLKFRTQSAVRNASGHFADLIPSSPNDIPAMKSLLARLAHQVASKTEDDLKNDRIRGYKLFKARDYSDRGRVPSDIEKQANTEFFWRDYALAKNIGAIVCKNLGKSLTVNAVVGAIHANAIKDLLNGGLKRDGNDLRAVVINSHEYGKSVGSTQSEQGKGSSRSAE